MVREIYKNLLSVLRKIFYLQNLPELWYFIKILIMRPLHLNQTPFFVSIEPTSRCNLRCIFCSNQEYDNDKKKDLNFYQFEVILSQLDRIKSLTLNGVGEPLLNKDLFRMIELAKRKKIYTGMATNGVLLNKLTAQAILDSKLDWILFPLDAASGEKYKNIKGYDYFDNVIANIRYLIQLKEKSQLNKKHDIPNISLNFVAMKNNIEELPRVVDLAASLLIKRVTINWVRFYNQDSSIRKMRDVDSPQEDVAKLIKREAISKAKQLGVQLIFFNDFLNLKKMSENCPAPWLSTFITSAGYVTPCCILNNSDKKNFGNIFYKNFTDIWNNSLYYDFRYNFKAGGQSLLCEGCNLHRDIYTNIDMKFFDLLRICGKMIDKL